jgi:hypothetical protein
MADAAMFLVFSNAHDGQDEEFGRWYDERHLPDVLAVPGIRNGRRYTFAPQDDSGDAPRHRYLAAYEYDDNAEPATIVKEFMTRMGDGTMDLSPAMDVNSVSMTFWQPLGPRRTAD